MQSQQLLRGPARSVLAASLLTCVDARPQPLAAADAPAKRDEMALYVSPAGNDTWSGTLAEPNRAGTDGPLATVQAARDRIRTQTRAAGGLRKPVRVMLRSGVYRLDAAIVFESSDSGTEACPVTYQAYPGERPVISGGRPISGWQNDDSAHSRTRCEGKLWRAAVPRLKDGRPWLFNQLFVNGERRTRSRLPNRGAFLRSDGPVSKANSRAFYFKEGDLQQWRNLRDAICVVYHSWETSIHHIRSVDTDAGMVTLREPAPWGMGRWEKQQRYYVENVFEALDTPGEWYLDRTTSTVYYYPLPNEAIGDTELIAPLVTSTLLTFAGDPTEGQPVEHLSFAGISFQHTNANLRRLRNPGQGEIYQPAMIMATGLRNAAFEDCEVVHTGAHAIWMAAGCENIRIQRCHMHSLGGGGVYIGGGWGTHEAAPTQRVTVDNCFIHDGSYLFHGAHGVWIGKSSHNTVTHNEISNFDYSGISCGWSWGFHPSSANHNILDYNHIHHLGNGDGLGDMGGIYTLGISPGTTERYNHIHDVYNYAHVSHGSGIYPDEGSSEILIENNVVYRVRNSPLFMHYGADCTVRNNVLALGDKGQLRRSREDKRCHYIAEGNIVYGDHPDMLDGPWKNGDWKVGRNLYWSTAGPPQFKGMDLAAWQAKGNDAGSIAADPLFVDPAQGDFRLHPDSPALALGFKPIDLSRTGLYGGKAWVDLPKQYKNRVLNEIPAPVEPPFIVNFDFETERPGEQPLDGAVIKGENGASLVVSPDTAATGNQSLRFRDAPDQKFSWTPHLYYRSTYTSGTVQLSWDMLNSAENPASFYVEVREWDVTPYLVGPTVAVAPDGTVTASGRAVGTIPLGAWAHVQIDIELGEAAPATYKLTLTVRDREPVVVSVPYQDATFRKITWLGVSSTSTAASVFYLDNLKLGTADELGQPPKRRRRLRNSRAKPRTPPNAENLVGHWKLDELGDYTARDSSGYANDGDVWAEWAKGGFGAAIYCEPGASKITIPDDPSLQFGTADLSISLWICPTQLAIASTDARRRFLNKDDYPRTWWNMNITTEGTPFLEMTDERKARCGNRPSGTIPEGAWTHLTVVVDRTNHKTRYYFNGKLDSAQDIPAEFTGPLDVTGADLSIGCSWQPFIGLIDDVKIYRRALTATEILNDCNKTRDTHTNAQFEIIE